MTKLQPIVAALILIVLAGLWNAWCDNPAVRAGQRLRDSTVTVDAHRHETDRRVAMLAAESLELGGKLRRLARNDSVARGEIARLRRRIPGTQPDSARGLVESPYPTDTLSPSGCAGAPAACDSIIADQDVALAASDSSLTLWRALAIERGELLTQALGERDSYRRIAVAWSQKAGKRFGCTAGPGVVVTIDGHVSAGAGFVCGFRV